MINQSAIFGTDTSLPKLFEASIDALRPNPDQSRQVFDDEALGELVASIEKHGLLQPIVVTMDPENKRTGYIIVAGERRWRAHKILKKNTIPAILSNGDRAELALIENVQRENLNPIEEASAYAHLIALHGYTQSDLEKVVSKKRRTINEIMQLNTLPEEILQECRALGIPSQLTKTAFVAISRIEDRDEQLRLWEEAKTGQLTTRQLEAKKKAKKPVLRRSRADRIFDIGSQLIRQLEQLEPISIAENEKLVSYLNEIRKQIDTFLSKQQL